MSFESPFRMNGRGAEEEQERARIALVAEVGDVRSLVDLIPFLPPEAHRLGFEAASAAAHVLDRCSSLELAWFDQWFRGGISSMRPALPPTWNDLRLGSPTWAKELRGVVALASFHRDGFVRERAVQLLTDFDDGFELPYLLIRSNDWVDEVQAAALDALSRRIARPYVPHWLRCLGLLDRLRATQRREANISWMVRRVEALLLDAGSHQLLATALSKGELAVRRAALRLAQALPTDDSRKMLVGSLHDRDPAIAIDAAVTLLRRARSEDASALVDLTIGHPLARVRVVALETALHHDVPGAIPALRRALLDDARSVRELARHDLSKREGAVDFASIYRDALRIRRGPGRRGAIDGLAEVGSRHDVELFLPLLHDSHARIRAAAIAGVARCDGASHLDALTAALRDRSSLVRRTAFLYAKPYLGRGFVQRVRRELRARS